MYDSLSEIVRKHETAVDDNGEHREYVVYKKDGVFVTECIAWKIKSLTQSGGSRDYYQEFATEEAAVEMYDALLAKWEED